MKRNNGIPGFWSMLFRGLTSDISEDHPEWYGDGMGAANLQQYLDESGLSDSGWTVGKDGQLRDRKGKAHDCLPGRWRDDRE